jgi:hypothetical protein
MRVANVREASAIKEVLISRFYMQKTKKGDFGVSEVAQKGCRTA